MIEAHFGLTSRPFPASPDTCLYYPSSVHEQTLAELQRAIADDEGILLLTGLPGTGKTLLGYALLDRLGGGVSSAFIANSHFADRTALLQAILYDLGLAYGDGTEQILRLRLTDHLLQNCAAKKQRTLLVIDEAHHLSADLLEELRLLANLDAGRDKAVQVLLIGQPQLTETLEQSGLESLHQRLAVRTILEPLADEEAYDYLLHHLRLAGIRPDKLFDEAALEILARGTQGIPRLLNQAGHQALILAEQGGIPRVDAEAALEALSILGLASEDLESENEQSEQNDSLPEIHEFRRPA